jgi:hypothetical protein
LRCHPPSRVVSCHHVIRNSLWYHMLLFFCMNITASVSTTLQKQGMWAQLLLFCLPCSDNCLTQFIHSFIYSYSIDHTDVEFVIKYKHKQISTIFKYYFR